MGDRPSADPPSRPLSPTRHLIADSAPEAVRARVPEMPSATKAHLIVGPRSQLISLPNRVIQGAIPDDRRCLAFGLCLGRSIIHPRQNGRVKRQFCLRYEGRS